ncbi:MAG: SET domain-containing protein-lysine N-methyltransferase [Akkermansiaceae bacterium]|nr:SET domain-containing protein-lysine N-methyltransferase [Akkermansiaceae bacterium]
MGKNKKKDRRYSEDKQERRIEKLRRRGESDFVEVRGSVIHGRGVYCIEPIEKEQYFIEYVGNRVSKEESEKRALKQFEEHEKSGAAAVYIFNLTKKWDLDGNVEWNPARLINHSCNPNSEAIQDGKRIFIQALRDIGVDEEITFDYGFDVDCYEDHPCRCGSSDCIGYIVGRDYHDDLAERLAAKQKATLNVS